MSIGMAIGGATNPKPASFRFVFIPTQFKKINGRGKFSGNGTILAPINFNFDIFYFYYIKINIYYK